MPTKIKNYLLFVEKDINMILRLNSTIVGNER